MEQSRQVELKYLAGSISSCSESRFVFATHEDTQEGEGNLLDRTIVVYGSSNSRTHNNHNYPLLLSGGGGLGLKHGQYLKFDERKMRLSNLYATILNRLGLRDEGFGDSTGEMTDVVQG